MTYTLEEQANDWKTECEQLAARLAEAEAVLKEWMAFDRDTTLGAWSSLRGKTRVLLGGTVTESAD